MNATTESRRKGRRTLIGLFALFLAPLLFAMAWYAFAPAYTPPATPNGTLIDPAQPLEPFRLESGAGETLTLEGLRGQWYLVHFVPDRCDAACRERLYETRQVRDALGEDRSRVRRLVVAGAGRATPGLADVLEEHPRLLVMRGDGRGEFGRQFPAERSADTVFVVDPLGNLMMRFEPGIPPGDMLKDLEKLLKLSRIG
ncbi:SCO family protein [Halofilum ochraceum]|uniref:SCO family protein n=1 Tax=Halofilum ochraceum TaxID=1611323 RepID=UPI0008DA08C4|nr:SCO family protein [Halofilum ochraceum]